MCNKNLRLSRQSVASAHQCCRCATRSAVPKKKPPRQKRLLTLRLPVFFCRRID